MFRSIIALLVLLILPLRANLGDSVEQCVKRYGKPVGLSEASAKSPFGTLVFVSGPYALVVFLLNNTEVGARVSKADKSAFAEDELKNIMKADATTPWVRVDGANSADLNWTRADRATVIYDKEKHVLIFTALAMVEALRSASAQPDAPATTETATPAATPAVPAAPHGPFVPAAPAVWTTPGTPTTNSPGDAGH